MKIPTTDTAGSGSAAPLRGGESDLPTSGPAETTSGITIVIASAVPALGAGLESWLDGARPGWEVIGVAHDGTTLQRILQEGCPDVLVAEDRLRGRATLEILRARAGRLPVLILISQPTPPEEAALVRAGASGVSGLDAPRANLLQAVGSMAAGRSVLSVQAARLLAGNRPWEWRRPRAHEPATRDPRPARTGVEYERHRR